MISTLHLGMQAENMDKQTLDCMEGINFCVNDIKSLADECLVHMAGNVDSVSKN